MTPARRVILTAGIVGLALNLWLILLKFQAPSGGIAGCGGAGACEAVLSSRWSEVFGIPLPVLGSVFYLALLIASVRKWGGLEMIASGALLGTITWLVFVQAAILHRFCPWCMAAHGVGLVVVASGVMGASRDRRFLRYFLAGLLAAGGLAMAQAFGPLPSGVAALPPSGVGVATDIHGRGTGRKVTFDQGRKTYDCEALPHFGSADAPHVLVEYFDFLCPACHRMQENLSALIEAWPEQICVIVLPVPLEHGCNPSLPMKEVGHLGSCEIARIALAVWRTKPDAYQAVHRRFMETLVLDPGAALEIAREYVDPAALAAAMDDPWIDEIIRADVADWDRYAGQAKILPQLLLNAGRILHGIPPDRATFLTVMRKELGL